MIFTQVDDMAFAGYNFAAGSGAVPALTDQIDVDAFNAGIANFNARHGATREAQRVGDRRCAASSRSVQRAKRTGSTVGLCLMDGEDQ